MKGYLAFLDILGFSAIVADQSNEQLERYGRSIADALKGGSIKSVVFSDSIVLTVEGTGPDALLSIVRVCSRLLAELVQSDISMRGAIAYGDFVRSEINGSVFVAGKALVDAYEWERKQDWVGIMVTPTALKTVPDLKLLCSEHQAITTRSLKWFAHLRHYAGIPFHATPDPFTFDGFVVLPCRTTVLLAEILSDIRKTINRLDWLRMTAPSPEAQQKYARTLTFYFSVENNWRSIAAAPAGSGM